MPAAVCSTGEQKALLIGLILAQARALKQKSPILLLDEVAAHLDAARRAALAEELLDIGLQVFMTGTDKSLFTEFGELAQLLQVADGQVSQNHSLRNENASFHVNVKRGYNTETGRSCPALIWLKFQSSRLMNPSI